MYIGEGNGNPLQYSCLENPMDRGAWWAAVYRVARSQTGLSDWLHFHFHALKKEMATHSSVLALRIPGTGEPGGLWSMGLHSVEHDWSNLAAAAAACIYIYISPPLDCSLVLWSREGHFSYFPHIATMEESRSVRDCLPPWKPKRP